MIGEHPVDNRGLGSHRCYRAHGGLADVNEEPVVHVRDVDEGLHRIDNLGLEGAEVLVEGHLDVKTSRHQFAFAPGQHDGHDQGK